MTHRDYYCSHKFTFLKVDLESQTTYNCHAAKPHKIDFEWLNKNPGQLFNTPINVFERQQMLQNQRNHSCEQNCWPAEDRSLPSPRLISGGNLRTHDQTITQPRVLDITLNTDCNLTCSYCCKEFSTSWRNDIEKNGNYQIESEKDRYSLHQHDKELAKISQNTRFNLQATQEILNEINSMAVLADKIIISGGEPFLSKYLLTMVEKNIHVPKIKIFTGLGMDYKRFERIIGVLSEHKNVILAVSADSVGSSYEFNRYGMKWKDFLKKIELLESKKIEFGFSTVISNLTVWGFADLYKMFGSKYFQIECLYNPNFLAPYVMDQCTKQQVKDQIQNLDFDRCQIILNSLDSEPTDQQRVDLAMFLKEFVRRRPGLDYSSFPATFKNWIEHVV